MGMHLAELPAFDPSSSLLNVIVESPKGSRNKYKFDLKTGEWRLSKVLPLGAAFPYDFGFIPSTCGEDGDPIDVMVLSEEPSFAGCILPCVLIGVLQAEQTVRGKTVRNDRFLAVVKTKHNPPAFESLDEVPETQLDEIEHFFKSYNEIEGREFKSIGRLGPIDALSLLNSASTNKG